MKREGFQGFTEDVQQNHKIVEGAQGLSKVKEIIPKGFAGSKKLTHSL